MLVLTNVAHAQLGLIGFFVLFSFFSSFFFCSMVVNSSIYLHRNGTGVLGMARFIYNHDQMGGTCQSNVHVTFGIQVSQLSCSCCVVVTFAHLFIVTDLHLCKLITKLPFLPQIQLVRLLALEAFDLKAACLSVSRNVKTWHQWIGDKLTGAQCLQLQIGS